MYISILKYYTKELYKLKKKNKQKTVKLFDSEVCHLTKIIYISALMLNMTEDFVRMQNSLENRQFVI